MVYDRAARLPPPRLVLAGEDIIPIIGFTAWEWARQEKVGNTLRQIQRALDNYRQRQSVTAIAGSVSPAARDEAGILVHTVRSEYQFAPTKIRVLLPTALDKTTLHPVLYVLPVEPMDGVQWGDGLREVRNNDLHNKFGLICVQPTFSDVPWYADHPTNATCRQETYFLKVVVPFIDRTYPGAEGLTLKLLFDPQTGRILGAQAVGGAGVDKRIDVLAVAIQAGMTVFDLEEMELASNCEIGTVVGPPRPKTWLEIGPADQV